MVAHVLSHVLGADATICGNHTLLEILATDYTVNNYIITVPAEVEQTLILPLTPTLTLHPKS